MIVLDTNAVIYYLQGDRRCAAVIDERRRRDAMVAISTITELEVLSFPQLDDMKLLMIGAWLSGLTIIPVDSSLASIAAGLRRAYRLKSPDAIIAATALAHKAALVTRDKQFTKITGLKVIRC